MSELTKRILSGILLAALLLGDVWVGQGWYAALLIVGALALLREFVRLIWLGWVGTQRWLWLVVGIGYIGAAAHGLWVAREQGVFAAMLLFATIWAVDIGAYAFGRLIGGPKIAPAISPSKTWAGFFGGFMCTTVVVFAATSFILELSPLGWDMRSVVFGAIACLCITALAQAGDFFESWLKRRAGVKDSGRLIPGHGGLFDRLDGLLPVAAIFPLFSKCALPI